MGGTRAHPLAHEGGGDDLDDGLELDASLLASDSEQEEEGYDEGDEDGDAGAFLSDDDEEGAPPAPGNRKRAAEEDLVDDKERKRRRREKDKARRAAKRALANGAEDADADADAARLSADALASALLASARAALPAASAMEIDDVCVPAERILEPIRTAEDGEGEGEYAGLIGRLNDGKSDAPKKPKPGQPRALVLCLSGIRCADVVRAVKAVPRHGDVAKLFAKHFKAAEQAKYLAKTRVAIAVGTPARVARLLADGALKMPPQSVVLLDIGHRDSKKRTLLTLPEVRDELWKSLFTGDARAALANAKFAAF